MLRKHYSLKTLFAIVTLLAIALFIYQQYQPKTWKSWLWDDEICSATVEFLMVNDEIIEKPLKKTDAIKLVRLAENCELGLVNTGMGGCMLPGTPVLICVKFELDENKTLQMIKLGQHLLIDSGTDNPEFIYIGSELDEFFRPPG